MQPVTHLNKYLPLALLYFFFNTVFLPTGLLYTSLLAPFFLLWIYLQGRPSGLWAFFSITFLFACIHLYLGVNLAAYIKSYVLLLTIFIFCVAFYVFLTRVQNIRVLYKNILVCNFALTLLALPFIFSPRFQGIFWYNNHAFTSGATDVLRLKMFTYESSYYSTLLAPIALYYYLKILMKRTEQKWVLFFMVSIPLVLSLSFGVLFGIILSILLVYCSDVRLVLQRKKAFPYFVLGAAGTLLIFTILLKYYPDNPFFQRFINVFYGQDTSFKGRTTDSFFIAWQIAQKKSVLFGCGPGQVKLLGVDVLRKFYQSNIYTSQTTSIPNSLAETLAIYGLAGLFLKLGAEIYLFFKTRLYRNYYRLSLFIFIFIYQFTGSFITNIAEYAIWILAFASSFEEFNKENVLLER